MGIVIQIRTDNAAFAEDFEGEVARLLESIASRISAREGLRLELHDANGNHCGSCEVTS